MTPNPKRPEIDFKCQRVSGEWSPSFDPWISVRHDGGVYLFIAILMAACLYLLARCAMHDPVPAALQTFTERGDGK